MLNILIEHLYLIVEIPFGWLKIQMFAIQKSIYTKVNKKNLSIKLIRLMRNFL